MQRYRNLSGASGVRFFEIGLNYIIVQFSEGATYTYSYNSAGANHIENMKTLAIAGSGLNGYINTYVRKLYA
jgi:hypothetical protein